MIGVDWHTVSLVEGRFALNLSTVNLSTVVWLDSGILRDDVAPSYARFGIFVGNARSLEIEGNRITQIPAFNTFYPRADAIRVVGYLGPKAIVRGNYVTDFPMGIRVIALIGNVPGTPVQVSGCHLTQ